MRHDSHEVLAGADNFPRGKLGLRLASVNCSIVPFCPKGFQLSGTTNPRNGLCCSACCVVTIC
ncbi:hypothetical protein Nepgr_001694 [Nepenthes gracilis]|uniref:Uncharacterized protein n=1 Tax=Nepenthes gracilis TaxID=150966 RepID=A0AAD3RXX8_NEPGR|nr:hypothetical protein Nepgr_001694 [Nepenthes gracilis]